MFILFLGCMYAGKTTSMLVKYFELTWNKKGLLFKHKIDTRNNCKKVIAHNKKININAIQVKNSKDILKYIKLNKDIKVVAIDELHFFDEGIIDVIKKMVKNGITILGTGLNSDYRREPWKVINLCISIADKIKHMNGICINCGMKSTCSYLKGHHKKNDDKLIMKSTNKDFIPLCTECYNKKYEYKNLIVLCGKKRTGKDTVANYLCKKYGYIKLSFANNFKKFTHDAINYLYKSLDCKEKDLYNKHKDYCGYNLVPCMVDGNSSIIISRFFHKDIKYQTLNDLTFRKIYQYFGTELFRKYFDKDIHAKYLWKYIKKKCIGKKIVITDCRFENELKYIKRKMKGNLLSIKITNNRSLKGDNHQSELVDFNAMVEIKNNGSLNDLYKNVDNILK